jgi:hypothetical protein
MNYIVSIEGQSIPLPEEIGSSDDAVKRALAPYYPEAANAMLTRVTQGDTTTITVIKKAGTKGRGLAALIACPGGKNPAMTLYEEINALDELARMDPLTLLEMDARIEEAITAGGQQAEAVAFAAKRLIRSAAQPAPVIILGF